MFPNENWDVLTNLTLQSLRSVCCELPRRRIVVESRIISSRLDDSLTAPLQCRNKSASVRHNSVTTLGTTTRGTEMISLPWLDDFGQKLWQRVRIFSRLKSAVLKQLRPY